MAKNVLYPTLLDRQLKVAMTYQRLSQEERLRYPQFHRQCFKVFKIESLVI